MSKDIRRCLILTAGNIERQLGDAVADGTLTQHDADQLRSFALFLERVARTDLAKRPRKGRDDATDQT